MCAARFRRRAHTFGSGDERRQRPGLAVGTRAIQATLESAGSFKVDLRTLPQRPEFSRYDVVVNNFNGETRLTAYAGGAK